MAYAAREGQIIAGAAFSGSNRAFDAQGRIIPVPSYDKFELGAYIEYGVTDWLTLIASPAYDRIRQPEPGASYDGLGQSGVGGRFKVYQSDAVVASLQTVLLSPGASFNGLEPHRAGSIDVRAMAGANFAIGPWPAFVDAAGGYRFYAQSQPGEWRLDLTLGVRPLPQFLLLVAKLRIDADQQKRRFPSVVLGQASGKPRLRCRPGLVSAARRVPDSRWPECGS